MFCEPMTFFCILLPKLYRQLDHTLLAEKSHESCKVVQSIYFYLVWKVPSPCHFMDSDKILRPVGEANIKISSPSVLTIQFFRLLEKLYCFTILLFYYGFKINPQKLFLFTLMYIQFVHLYMKSIFLRRSYLQR